MSKDPAFLFYFQDYLNGTRFMTLEEKGAYMELLCHQADKGKFTIEVVKKILRNDFERIWGNISEKFICEGELYFNQRLEQEKEKRRKHTEHQKENVSRRWNKNGNTKPIPSYENGKTVVIPLENINENVNEDFKEEGVIGETNELEEWKQEIGLEPLEERKSKYGGPDYKSVEIIFIARNRPKEEAAIFWNEYESKEWCVHNKEGTGKRKITSNWRYKAENWIFQANLAEMEKKKNGKSKQNTSGASNEFLAKLSANRAIREQQGK